MTCTHTISDNWSKKSFNGSKTWVKTTTAWSSTRTETVIKNKIDINLLATLRTKGDRCGAIKILN